MGIVGWMCVEWLGLFELQYLYAAMLMFVVGIALVIVTSLLTPAPSPEKVEGHVWRKRDAAVEPGTPWYVDYRVQSVALAAVTLSVVVWWW